MTRTRLICGVGINNANYTVKKIVNGVEVSCPYYRTWKTMVSRCYSLFIHNRAPAYIGCKVDNEWLSFMNFRKWMKGQYWKGKHLDKDIIKPSNKTYSSEACCFVSQELNKLLTDSARIRGKYPIGVYLNKDANRFQAYIKKYGVKKSLGYYETPEEAAEVYRKAKSAHVMKIALEQTDVRIQEGLIKHAEIILAGI